MHMSMKQILMQFILYIQTYILEGIFLNLTLFVITISVVLSGTRIWIAYYFLKQ